MSTYLISDMHGEKKIFDKLIKNLDFQVDKLYILGDVIDRGQQSMELLDEVRGMMTSFSQNVYMIKGNHELFCEMYIDGRLSERVWLSEGYGGGPMLKAMKKMSKEDIADLNAFIKGLPIYLEIESPVYGKMVLTHSGINADVLVRNDDETINVIKSIEAGYASNDFNFLCSGDIHRMPVKMLDKFMVVGHSPTIFLEGNSYKIYRRNKYICIDSGGAHRDLGGKQSMYCVEEDMAVYL